MEKISFTPTEWKLMECLWENSPCSGRQATEYLEKHVGWTRSTTLTLLRRMTDKGMIRCDESGSVRTYSPLVCREEAVTQETEDFLDRVYKGSVSLMMNAITKKQTLSKAEIDELYSILREAERGIE